MAYKSWSPLWSVIVDSSLWDEPDWIVKIFVTMLAKKDSDHIYRGTAYQLHKDSRKTEVEVLEALKVLSSPDTLRQEAQPYEGRRVKAVPEGWLILNGEVYRDMVATEMRRRSNARAQEKFRKKQKLAQQYPVSGAPLAGERAFVSTADREGMAAADADFDRHQINGEALVKAMVRVETAEAGKLGRELAGDIQREQVPETVAERLTRLGQEDLARRGVVIQPKSDLERPNCDDGK